jgi:hypothetical protein
LSKLGVAANGPAASDGGSGEAPQLPVQAGACASAENEIRKSAAALDDRYDI